MMRTIILAAALLALPACTHLKGVVVQDPGNKPLPTARFTVGRPDGIAVFETHEVNQDGAFDFFVFPTDDSAVYVFDNAQGPEATMRRIDRTEMNEHMRIHIRRPTGDMPSGVGNFGVGP